ncbi:MAG: hypothetical protein M1832_002161 [Thelocarpon impressellum]|nr:MAG: hypothetical protein M1832_002161 [Thelocarpon impressellum]
MPTPEADSTSENDNERPVREKFKKASLGALPKYGVVPTDEPDEAEEDADARRRSAESPDDPSSTGNNDREHPEANGVVAPAGSTHKHAHVSHDDAEDQRTTDRPTKASQRNAEVPTDGGEEGSGSAQQPPSQVIGETAVPDAQILSGSDDSDGREEAPAVTPAPSPPTDAAMEDARDRLVSPKKKRSRDQFDKDHAKEELQPAASEDEPRRSQELERVPSGTNRSSRTTRDEPEKKRYRDASQEAATKDAETETTILPTTGFSNTSATSPFGALAANKISPSASPNLGSSASSDDRPASSSAFAASGFGALAGSSVSGFGTLGAAAKSSGTSPFGSLAATKPASSGFGALSETKAATGPGGFGSTVTGPSAFGSGASGFGKLGGGLASGFGGFGSKAGSGIIGLSDKPAKAFGAPEEDDDDDDDDDDDGNDDDVVEDGETTRQASEDRRSHEHEVATGEEGEETVFSGQAKLYYLNRGSNPANHGWKERGLGLLKLNTSVPTADVAASPAEGDIGEGESEPGANTDKKKAARLIMRAMGVYRVILNVPVYKHMKLLSPEGDVPTSTKSSRSLMLTIIEEGKPVMLQIKFRDSTSALDLYDKVTNLQQDM